MFTYHWYAGTSLCPRYRVCGLYGVWGVGCGVWGVPVLGIVRHAIMLTKVNNVHRYVHCSLKHGGYSHGTHSCLCRQYSQICVWGVGWRYSSSRCIHCMCCMMVGGESL